jgi:hypothetical protein
MWILVDRALLYTKAAACWSHGKIVDGDPVPIDDSEKIGRATRWSKSQKKEVTEWLAYVCKGDRDKQEELRPTIEKFFKREVEVIISKSK